MQTCLGIYIESNLIKYAKVSRDDNKYKNSFSNMLFSMSNGNVYSYELKEKEW